ncbi:MAG: DUF362 domain-containing protein [Patescibacteria group bacterium]|nr:DUF362 domain-containing protein [Patescibacteria group bacterium]
MSRNYVTRRQFVRQSAAGIGMAGMLPAIISGVESNSSAVSQLKSQGCDYEGSPVSVVKVNPELAYAGVPLLLQRFINENDGSAWKTICKKIDYIYQSLNPLMKNIDGECGCITEAAKRVESGQNLFFKINTVIPAGIDPITHGEGVNCTACTDWAMIAALLRWFHDVQGISYHHMALGEGGALHAHLAIQYTMMQKDRRVINQETVLEGKSGDFYGGWGFYFARKYLADTHTSGHTDDPMKGFEESVNGIYVPPGKRDGLYVYATNCVDAGEIRGREIPVPDGENYKTVMLHKAIIGGDPDDAEDRKKYPGSVLINVPKMKVHPMELMTNAIKNLGIGLYPTEAGWDKNPHNTDWRYGIPKKYPPSIKNVIHDTWHPEIDSETWITKRDEKNNYIVNKTGGIRATMVDVNMAVLNQGIQVLHIVDAIHGINISHTDDLPGCRRPEGLMIVGPDPVAIDLFCARYMFHQVPSVEIPKAQQELSIQSDFIQKVPIPTVKGTVIESVNGYNAPLTTYNLFSYAEQRKLGKQQYYVFGVDLSDNTQLVSKKGHFGKIVSNEFKEMLTGTTYFNQQKFFWDMQKTSLAYLAASDQLTGGKMKNTFLTNLDDDNDGIVWCHDAGKGGTFTSRISLIAESMYIADTRQYGNFVGSFINLIRMLKAWRPEYNAQGTAVFEDYINSFIIHQAYLMSLMPERSPDPVVPGMEFGRGLWPSFKYAEFVYLTKQLYGADFPSSLSLSSLFGNAFQYADKMWNNGKWTGGTMDDSNPVSLGRYIKTAKTVTQQLCFILFVPKGYGKSGKIDLPNIQETDDPALVFTADFNNREMIWT